MRNRVLQAGVMPTEIHVHLLPEHVASEQLQGGIVVMVDVLRASTTIVTALHNKAAAVIPCLSVEDARVFRTGNIAMLLGGERGGVRIDGFDLSNSPTDYDRSTVENRTIAFTTTNGTRALLHSVEADQVFVGAFVNLEALADYFITRPQPLHIVCAGTNGQVTGEDNLFAGCLIDRVLSRGAASSETALTDTAAMTLGWWRFESGKRPLAEMLMTTCGGRNLISLSCESDIEIAAELNRCPVLAEFDPGTGLITI